MAHLLINLSLIPQKLTGIGVYASSLLPHLRRLNPKLLSPIEWEDFEYQLISEKLTPDSGFTGHFRRMLWTQLQLPQIFQTQKASLLFSPFPEAPLYRKSCRFIVTIHDLIPLRFPKVSSPLTHYFRLVVPQIIAQADHILCNSLSTAREVSEYFNIPASKMTAIPLAYPIASFYPLELPQQNYFLYVGRQDPHKNLGRLIDAFAALPYCQDEELWIAGPPDSRYTPDLQERAESWGISHRVRFLGYVSTDHLRTLLNQAIALVFPSLWEGFGLPVLEAMACGTPVITSNNSGLQEVAGDAALLIDPYRCETLTAAMLAVATDAQLRLQLRQMGLARATQFSWEKTGQETLEVLQAFL